MSLSRSLARAPAGVYFLLTTSFWLFVAFLLFVGGLIGYCMLGKGLTCPSWSKDTFVAGLSMVGIALGVMILTAIALASCDPLCIWCCCIPRSYLLARCRYGPSEGDAYASSDEVGSASEESDTDEESPRVHAQGGGL